MQHQVTITDEEVDRLLVEAIQRAYILNHIPVTYDCSDINYGVDHGLLHAMEVILQYYLTEDDFKAWMESIQT